jgi:hypothetical protein
MRWHDSPQQRYATRAAKRQPRPPRSGSTGTEASLGCDDPPLPAHRRVRAPHRAASYDAVRTPDHYYGTALPAVMQEPALQGKPPNS